MNIPKRLDWIRLELAELSETLRVSTEQLSFLGEVADDARTAMLISQAPSEKRQFEEASGDLDRHRRYHHELHQSIGSLRKEQNDLLDELLNQSPG